MNRRDFLRSAGAAGGLFATAGLFAGEKGRPDAAETQAIFEKRYPHERLALAYQHVPIGLEQPFSILHISDTHLCAAYAHEPEHKRAFAKFRTQVFGGRMEEALRDSLAWAKENVDAVLHTGDLIDFQTEANCDLVKKYFGQAPNLFGCPGNHEFQRRLEGEPIRNTFDYNALSAAELQKVFPHPLHFHATVIGGVNFISIEQTYGVVSKEQVERFREEEKKGLPIVLSMHTPFMTDEIWRASQRFWPDCGKKYRSAALAAAAGDYKRQLEDPVTSAFVASLKKQPLLKAICAGHLHITISDQFSPTAREYVVGSNFLFHGQEILFT
jgi:DNA repair exonuclease SbcCD nuclease subunit